MVNFYEPKFTLKDILNQNHISYEGKTTDCLSCSY